MLIQKIEQKDNNGEDYRELALTSPDPPEHEDDGDTEGEAQADQAHRHEGVAAEATSLATWNRTLDLSQEIHHLGLALEVAHVAVVQVLDLSGPGEHGVGAVTVAPGAHAGHVVTLEADDAALGARLTNNID